MRTGGRRPIEVTPNPYMREAASYLHEGDKEVTTKVLEALKRLDDAPDELLERSCGGTSVQDHFHEWFNIQLRSDRDGVSMSIAREDGEFVECRFERGNGDPVRFLLDDKGAGGRLGAFVPCAILHVENALDDRTASEADAAIRAAVGRTMRQHRRSPIEDWRKEVHAQTATPWSPPRTFVTKVDGHGNCVADRNLLSTSLRRTPATTSVTVEGNRMGRSMIVHIRPSMRILDPETIPIMEEMRAYEALSGEHGVTSGIGKAA
jgi:hypothetical protein